MRIPVLRGLAAAVVLLLLTVTAWSAVPIGRGDDDYDPASPASYESIQVRYAEHIEVQDWNGFLEALERDFFRSAPQSPAEKRAQEGFRETRQKFIASLHSARLAVNDLVEPATEELKKASADTAAEVYVAGILRHDPLPRALTGVFLWDEDPLSQSKTVFVGAVHFDEALPDTSRLPALLRKIRRGTANPSSPSTLRLFKKPGPILDQAAFEQRAAALASLISSCGTDPGDAQIDSLRMLMDIVPEPVFSRARAQEIFSIAESVSSVLAAALAPHRQATLKAIAQARGRWEDYTAKVVAHQFPWEMAFNELTGLTGSLERPPTRQFSLLHPLLAVELADPRPADAWRPLDELTVQKAMQVNLLGWNWLDADGGYGRRFGLSGCVTYRDDVARPGYGVALGFGRWAEVAVVYRQFKDKDNYSVAVSADFWGLIQKEQSGFVRKNARWLEKVEHLLN